MGEAKNCIFNVIPETEEKKNTAALDLLDLDKKTTDDEKLSASLLSGFLVKVLRVAGYLKGRHQTHENFGCYVVQPRRY